MANYGESDLARKAAKARREWLAEKERLEPEIAKLSGRADMLAVIFREHYANAQLAYDLGDGERAKTLKDEGFAMEEECRSLNAEANQLRARLHYLKKQSDDLRSEAENEQHRQHKRSDDNKRSVRDTFVEGFARSPMSEKETAEFLGEFPSLVFEHIGSIEYFDRPHPKYRGLMGETTTPIGRKAEIEIYKHEEKAELKDTVAHEIGHIIVRDFIGGEHWNEWFDLDFALRQKRKPFITRYAKQDVYENFCECYGKFKADPQALLEYDQKIYNFMADMEDSLKQ